MREEHQICPNAGGSSGWSSLGEGGKALAAAMEVGGVGGVMRRKIPLQPDPRSIKKNEKPPDRIIRPIKGPDNPASPNNPAFLKADNPARTG